MAWGAGTDKVIDSWINRLETDDPTFTSLNILGFRKPSQLQYVKLFTGLKNNTNLKELYCSGKIVEGEGLEALVSALSNNITLEKLSLGYSKFGEEKELVDLYCSGLSKFRGYLEVDLAGFGLCSDNLTGLSELFRTQVGLKRVNLSYNLLDSTSLETIGSAICENSRMALPLALEVNGNPIDSFIKFSEYFNSPEFKLGELDSYDNSLSNEDLLILLNNVRRSGWLKTLRFSLPESQDIPHSDLVVDNDKLIQLPITTQSFDIPDSDSSCNDSLETLVLAGFPLTIPQLKTTLSPFTSLKSFTIRRAELTDSHLTHLITCLTTSSPQLDHLDVGTNHLTGLSLWKCLELPQLRKLTLFGNPLDLVSSSDSPSSPLLDLPSWSHLTHLDLNCTHLTLTGLTFLLDLLLTTTSSSLPTYLAPHLVQLEVAGNDKANLEAWSAPLHHFSQLRPTVAVSWK